MLRRRKPASPIRYFNSSPKVIRLMVLIYVRFPLSLRNVEDLLFEREIDICHETVRPWWNKFGPLFAGELARTHSVGEEAAEPRLREAKAVRTSVTRRLPRYISACGWRKKRAAAFGFGLKEPASRSAGLALPAIH